VSEGSRARATRLDALSEEPGGRLNSLTELREVHFLAAARAGEGSARDASGRDP
jgi:hypothetical protein